MMIAGQIRPTDSSDQISNADIAKAMLEVADLLEAQQANPFRINAYRKAAETLKALPKSAADILATGGKAWLPTLHTHRGERHYTALFSNTAHAHEMRATHDWVVIYRDDHGGHGQWTVITSTMGKLTGRRIVRGREAECREFYGLKKQRKVEV